MSRSLREKVSDLVEQSQFEVLADLVLEKRSTLRYLYRLLYATDEITRCRTIWAMGIIAQKIAQTDPESVRVIIRTLLWTINDESGGIGWSAPEAIAEIVYRLPETFGEFATIVLTAKDEPALLSGVVRAGFRMAQSAPELLQSFMPEYIGYLKHPDPQIRGCALGFIYYVGGKIDWDQYEYLLQDEGIVTLYENGAIKDYRVRELAVVFFPAFTDKR